jgi:mersacidin/lichenicidin family type 2 lantibiotic
MSEHNTVPQEPTPEEIVRAWKDEDFRNSLSEEQLANLPPSPDNLAELSDEDLEEVAGGAWTCAGSCGQTCSNTNTDPKETEIN